MVAATPRTRSGTQIQQDVLDELKWDNHVTASDVGVTVKDGIVTLAGTVESYLVRQAAENAALRVKGVNAVANELEVKLPSSTERTDSDLALAALYALKWDAAISTDKLDVAVTHGWVSLKGEVEWNFQREAAERVVRRLAGVRGVSNFITVAVRPTPADIKQRIEKALVRNAQTDARDLTVEVTGNTVVLKGTVRSYAEKVAAERSAWAAPGIMAVDNRILISYAD